ncbi:hypothetical protein R83H12_02085 [Fibrobacteria bacterium R8-3-H12]
MQAMIYIQDMNNSDKKLLRYDIIVTPNEEVSGEFFVEHSYSNGDKFRRGVRLINGTSEKQVLESELNEMDRKFPASQYVKKLCKRW